MDGSRTPEPRQRASFSSLGRRSTAAPPATSDPFSDPFEEDPAVKNRYNVRNRLRSPWFWVILIALVTLNWYIAGRLTGEPDRTLDVSYSFFRDQVADGNVESIRTTGDEIRGEFVNPVIDPDLPDGDEGRRFSQFTTRIPAFADPATLEQLLIDQGVTISAEPFETGRSTLLLLFVSFGPAIFLIGGFLWLSKRSGAGGLLRIGRSRARRYDLATENNRITFDDVAGIDEVKGELVEIVDFLKHPDRYRRLGGVIPKGVLLVGPPGTGKTLLARAVAGEAGVPFFSMSASEFIEMIVGVGASRVRDLFAEAKKAAPAIIFVDELDAIGRRRGANILSGGSDEREQTLNQLLVEMDGFDASTGVIILAATNRADVLDPALLRPGRFDRRVVVQPPDRHGREAILRVHTRSVPLEPSLSLGTVAGETAGLVGADLRNLVNEAALIAARKEKAAVGQEDFTQALERIALGAKRQIALSAHERQRVAYHEAGHALAGLLQPASDPVRRVTVVPHGQALGVTLSVPEIDRYNLDEAYLRARIVNALAGRVAEEIIFGTPTTGAENDIRQATMLARAMVARWGMAPEIGMVALDTRAEGDYLNTGPGSGEPGEFSEETARTVDRATRRIIDECYAIAMDLLTRERHRLDVLAQALLERETLGLEEMLRVTGLAGRDIREPVIVTD